MQPQSAKQSFTAGPTATLWAEISSGPVFRAAAQHALLQMLQEMPATGEPSKHWDAYSQLVGARRLVEILSTLSDQQQAAKKTETPTLNYDSKR